MAEPLTIREVARQTGLSLHTLRYYERVGLIEGVGRASNSHRRYAHEDIVWLEFLKRLRATGMPIAEMKRFAALRRQGAPSLKQRRQMLVDHHAQVAAQITALQDNLEAIQSKIERLAKQENTKQENTKQEKE